MAISETVKLGTSNHRASGLLGQGRGVLRDPHRNRGTAFTHEERAVLGLEGLLPAGVSSLEAQARRSHEQYSAQQTDLAKNDFLAALHDRNEVLYYKLLELPIFAITSVPDEERSRCQRLAHPRATSAEPRANEPPTRDHHIRAAAIGLTRCRAMSIQTEQAWRTRALCA